MLQFLDNPNSKKVILVFAAYGIVQVLAQDLGIKTGKKQRDLIQTLPMQLGLLYSAAYTVTEDHQLSAISVGIYYFLKYVYAGGETSEVCFEDV